MCIERKDSATCEKPCLSVFRWKQFTAGFNPEQVKAIRMVRVNLDLCYREVFDFMRRCKNTKQLFLYDIGDAPKVVDGFAAALPALVKLKVFDTRGVTFRDRDVIGNIGSDDLRGLTLCEVGVLDEGTSLLVCLPRLSLLTYLYLHHCGFSRGVMLNLLKSLPITCPNIVYLAVVGVAFTSNEMKPLLVLNELRGLFFQASTSKDLFQTLRFLPQKIELLYLQVCQTPGQLQGNDFVSVIRGYKMIKFLILDEDMLDGEAEDMVGALMKEKGGCYMRPPTADSQTTPQEWKAYEDKLREIRQECFNAE